MAKEPEANEVMSALTELRETVEKSKIDGLDQVKVDKINKFLDEQEETNQKKALEAENLKTEVEAKQKAFDELKEEAKEMGVSIEALELAASKSSSNPANYKDGDEYQNLNKFAMKGFNGLSVDETKTLRTDRDTSGGVLVPVEMSSELLKEEVEISPMRSISRVRTMNSKTVEVPRRTTPPTATYEGEAEAGGDSNSSYKSESLTAFRQTTTVPITMDMLNDSSFDMISEINSDVVLSFAQSSGDNFINGDGVKKPKGFLSDSRVTANPTVTATSGAIDADAVLAITGAHKLGYNPVYVFNQRTLATLRQEKSTDGVYLWQPGLNGVVANTLAGFPYFIMPDMPDITNSAFALAFGDFKRGYEVADRTGMAVIRDDVTQKKSAIVEFTFHRWNTGQVVVPEAIKVLQIKA